MISEHGNTFHVPFAAMGSGSLAAVSILEANYREDLTEEEAIELAADAIQAGIMYDLGSGSNVNIFSITKDGTDKKFGYRVFNNKMFKDESLFSFENKKVEVTKKQVIDWNEIKVTSNVIPNSNSYSMMELI